MRSENEDLCSMAQSKSDHDTIAFYKESKISYTQSFLLSLSELDTCKSLPSGFDKSVLGGLNDSWAGLLQPSPNSDSGRYQGYISRCACQNPEIGVLGPGAFPRISSCVSGTCSPVAQGSGYHLLNRSSTAYRPPHLSKAKHQSRRKIEDSYNDETFGSSKHLSQEREDEERRRRDSFELMRKEQWKAFQMKEHKLSDEHKENLQPDTDTTLEASKNDEGLVKTYNESEKALAVDSAGHYVTAKSEILLPPALKRSHEKNLVTKPSIRTSISKPFELSIISEFSEHYSTQYQSIERRGRVPYFANELGASRDLTMTASSKLKVSFSDKFSFSEARDNGFGKNLQTTEFSGIHREPHEFPFLACDDNYIIPSTVNESGSIKMYPKGIMSSGHAKKTVESKIVENLSMSDDIQTKIGLESKLSPVSAFNETVDLMNDIHLPDEDSLITVDDCILPLSDVVAARRPVKADSFTSSSQVNIADKLAAYDLSFIDERPPQLGLEGPIFDSYNMIGLDTYPNLHTQQSQSHFSCYQTNPGRAFSNSSNAQEVHMSSDMRFWDQETYRFNPQQTLHPLPTNMFADPFQRSHAELSMFDHTINAPSLHHMHIPSKFSSPHQVRGLTRGFPSYHPMDEMTRFTPNLHPEQNFRPYLQQQYYGGLEMPISDQTAAGNNYQAACNRLLEMEVRAKRMHHPTVAGLGSKNFGREDDIRTVADRGSKKIGRQVDLGVWYGH
ncbi:hypothetical protein Ddye_013840 [Dipteronia dyeriana]|uniref:Uncharacterized protein n=1 Tax=Dipteronia dyeriana TaxID=168575 RepID=A0AAD9X744_9ROSI|nr:hypothetical protein Ddye_013840 [Dipteronia dyeriana]